MRKQGIQILSVPILILILFSNAKGQPNSKELAAFAEGKMDVGLTQLEEILSIPNNASFPEHVERNVSWCRNEFEKRNFDVATLDTGGPPILLAEKSWNEKGKTVLIYLQIDGQPVYMPLWKQESPYLPVYKEKKNDEWVEVEVDKQNPDREARIFARSASDAKGPVIMFLQALDVISENGFEPNYNIKVIMDFEEELGSPHLPAAVSKYKQELSADMLIIFDGPRHISNQPTLTFGARGITTITLTTYGPKAPQHSGHYGNYAPNPTFKMAHLLSSLKTRDGRVAIEGYYDDVKLDQDTRNILSQVPDNEQEIRDNIGIATIDNVASTYQEAIQYPSLNIRGLQSAWVESEVRTIVPDKAIAEIDVRLVPETSSEKLVSLIKDHISSGGFTLIDHEPTLEERMADNNLVRFEYENSYAAFRTDFNSEVGQWLYRALVRAFDQEPIRIRMSGGSIPIAPFVSTLDVPAVTVPTVNRDNNQHSPNENLRLGNFEDGIRTILAILTEDL